MKKLYAILIEDKFLKDSPYFYMSAGDERQQGRCFIYQDKNYARIAKNSIKLGIKDSCKVIIKELKLI
jgi:hypothetical protein